jgi:hypothetical protein
MQMDEASIIISGPEALIQQLLSDKRLPATLVAQPSVESGGPLAEGKLGRVLAIAIPLMGLLNSGMTAGEHIHHWMHHNQASVCEITIRSAPGQQQNLRFNNSMTPEQIQQLIQEGIANHEVC